MDILLASLAIWTGDEEKEIFYKTTKMKEISLARTIAIL